MVRALVLALCAALLTASVVAAGSFPIVGYQIAPSGAGWRLVSEVRASGEMAYTVRVATDRAAYDELWHELGWNDRVTSNYTNVAPWLAVDFQSEIAVVFSVGIGSCTDGVRLDAVVIDQATQLVYSVTSESAHCGFLDLTGADAFVVALDRDALPPSPFTLRLHADLTCSCPDHEDQVTVSLAH